MKYMQLYSHSRLSTYEHCPLKFYYQYVAKVKVPEGRTSAEAFMGSRVHEALEKLYKDAQFGKTDPLEGILEFYRNRWQQEWSEEVEIVKEGLEEADFQRMGAKCLEQYYRRYSPFDQSKTIATEHRILARLDEGGEYKLQGFVDRIAVSGRDYEIHDYKTNRRLREQHELDSDRQLALYQLGVQQAWPDAERIELIWHFLVFDKEMRSNRTRTQLESVKKKTIKLIDEIEFAKEGDRFHAHKSELCDYCEYKAMCPEWKHVLSVQLSLNNEFADLPGVALADEYAKLKEQEREISGKLESARLAVMDFARREGVTVIQGSKNQLLVRTDLRTGYPSKSAEPLEYHKLERLLKAEGVWQDVSTLSPALLEAAMKEGKISAALAKRISEFQSVQEITTVRIGKRGE